MAVCTTDAGYISAEAIRFAATTTAAGIRQATAVLQFALNAADAISNYKKLADVSARGIAVEEQQHAHVRDNYWPRETQFLNEFTAPTPWEDQAVLARRYAGRMWASAAPAFAKQLKEMEVNRQRYHGVSYFRAVQEILSTRGQTKANIAALADRIAYAEIQAVNDRDFDRRKAAIAMRQGLIGQAATLLGQAAQGLAGAGADNLGEATSAIQGFKYYGEYAERTEQIARMKEGRREEPGGITNRVYDDSMLPGGYSLRADSGDLTSDANTQVSAPPEGMSNNEIGGNTGWTNNMDALDTWIAENANSGVQNINAGDPPKPKPGS
jgi:hypothetical protein